MPNCPDAASRRQFLQLGGACASLALPFARRCLAFDLRNPAEFETPAAYWIGSSYYPEQVPEREWEDDFRKMSALGLNVVRMAEFAWSSLQPSLTRFDFGWLDRAIELAHAHNIQVLLGLPTAALPPWLYRLHPEVLGGDERGPFSYGGRKGFCLYSPAMKRAAQTLIGAMAQRYGSNRAVAGWQLSNEPGFPLTAYDPQGLQAFRLWLKQRYGTLDALNHVWGGAFWSNHYDHWDEIQFPVNVAESGFYPAVRLDYRRFFSDSYVGWLRFEAETLRSYGVKTLTFVNWPETQWSVDIHATEGFVGATGFDNYGRSPDDRDNKGFYDSAMNLDFCRCSRADQRFFVVEQRCQAPATSSPAAVRLQTFADFAHGSFGTLYFEWRSPLAGSERGYVSILDRDGSLGPSAMLIQRTAAEFQQMWKEMRDAKTNAKVAMLFSYDNQWDVGFGERDLNARTLSYDESFSRFYLGAKTLGQNIDIISTVAPLSGYSVVIAPGLQMVSDGLAARLTAFVAAGGTLILDQTAGTRDQTGRERPLNGPGVFHAVAGLTIESTTRVDGELPTYTLQFADGSTRYPVLRNLEKVIVASAKVLAWVKRPDLNEMPAITVNQAGEGRVLYFAASSIAPAFYRDAFQRIGRMLEMTPILKVPEGVEVVSRDSRGVEYIFVQNTLAAPQSVPLERDYQDALTREAVRGELKLPGFEVRVIHR